MTNENVALRKSDRIEKDMACAGRLRSGSRWPAVSRIPLAAGLLGVCLALSVPSWAFHDSGLDSGSKQALTALHRVFTDQCRAGNAAACAGAQQVKLFAQQLFHVQQLCATGNAQACLAAHWVRQQFAAILGPGASSFPLPVPGTSSVPPGASANPYDWRTQVPPGAPYGNPYDWRNWEPPVDRPRGNPYDWKSWTPEPKGPVGNPYDWRNYPDQ